MFKRIKRIMMIGLVCMSLVSMLGTDVWAYRFRGGSFSVGSPYLLTWELVGSAGNVYVSLLEGTIFVTKAAAIYFNPQGKDTTVGVSGVRVVSSESNPAEYPVDGAGHTEVPQMFPFMVGDEVNGFIYDTEALALYYGVPESIKNGKWFLGAFAMLEGTIRGTILKCDADTAECVIEDEAAYQFWADVEGRDFTGALPIVYELVELN